MLKILNHLLTTPPSWDDHEEVVGVVGVPFQVIFDWPMGTASGYAVFQDPEVNCMLKKVLNEWGKYLQTPDSRRCLGTDIHGWFGEVGKRDLEDIANGTSRDGKRKTFEELFHCEAKEKYYGYKSWDDFFTRRFRFGEGVRPVASPHDDSVIANACEARMYKVGYDVQAHDRFWAKGQPYSVMDILDRDEWAEEFVGGTIYQAFLSSLSYHRWHSPVSGKVVKTKIVDGTYFSEPPYTGWQGKRGLDVEGQITGQGYLAAMATRGLIFIEADNPDIGLLCVVPIGMVEVSTCDITVKKGDRVKKGDEIGMFHFGGSTHCVLFRKGVKIGGFPDPGSKNNISVRGELARVSRSASRCKISKMCGL
jgi:phosphatidylserine decarboxylase